MRKLFKKSLACVLAVALCLTAMVGAMVVSADVVGTLTVEGYAGTVGTATAEDLAVTATFAAPENELISESFIDVAVVDAEGNTVAVESVALTNAASEDDTVALNTAKTRFNIASDAGMATAIVKIVIAADPAVAGTYTVTLTDVTSATDSQSLITFAPASANVVLEEPALPVEPELDENIGMSIGINISNTINLRYIATAIPTCADFYFEFSSYRCDLQYNFGDEPVAVRYYKNDPALIKVSDTSYAVLYTGLGAYELNLEVTAKLVCLDENGNEIYYSNDFKTTVAEKIKSAIPGLTNAKTKALYTDIINYATEAQLYFAYNSNGTPKDCDLAKEVELANVGMTGGTPSPDFDKETALNRVDTSNDDPDGDGIGSGVTATVGINAGATPTLRYIVSNLPENFKIVATYNSPKLGDRPQEITASTEGVIKVSEGQYAFLYTQLAYYDTNQPVTLTAYDADGNEIFVSQYTIENSIYNANTSSRVYALYSSLAKVGISARAHFGM